MKENNTLEEPCTVHVAAIHFDVYRNSKNGNSYGHAIVYYKVRNP